MKKLNILLSSFIFVSSIPLYAAFCINCGNNLPKEANFCPNCGTASLKAFQSAEPESKNESASSNSNSINTIDNTNHNNTISIDSRVAADNNSLSDYHFINKKSMLRSL